MELIVAGAIVVAFVLVVGLWLHERLARITQAKDTCALLGRLGETNATHHMSSMTQAIRDLELLREAHKDNTRLEQECLALSQECYNAGIIYKVDRAMQALDRDKSTQDLMKALTKIKRDVGIPAEPVLRMVPNPTTPPEGDKS